MDDPEHRATDRDPGDAPSGMEAGALPPEPAGAGRPAARILNAAFVAAFAAVVALSAHLEPSPSGVGTHTQLGLPPCGLYQTYGVPCLSCGMTTAFAHAVRFQVIDAFKANPLGLLVFVAFAISALMNAWAAVTGWSFFGFLDRLDWTRLGLGFVALSVLSWAYKIAAVVWWKNTG